MPKAIAKVYFNRGHEQLAKDLAVRIRNEGNQCHLICANFFRGDQDIEEDAHAIAIQASSGKAAMIGRTYNEFNKDVEVHFFNDEGDFVDGPDNPEPKPADPFAALKEPAATEEAPAGDDTPEPEAADETPEAEAPAADVTEPADAVTEQPADDGVQGDELEDK